MLGGGLLCADRHNVWRCSMGMWLHGLLCNKLCLGGCKARLGCNRCMRWHDLLH